MPVNFLAPYKKADPKVAKTEEWTVILKSSDLVNSFAGLTTLGGVLADIAEAQGVKLEKGKGLTNENLIQNRVRSYIATLHQLVCDASGDEDSEDK